MFILLAFLSIFISLFISKKMLDYLINKYPEYSMENKFKMVIYILSVLIVVFIQYKILQNKELSSINWIFTVMNSLLIVPTISSSLAISFIIDCLFQELPDENNILIGLCVLPMGLYQYGFNVLLTAIILFSVFFMFAILTGQLGMGDVKMVLFMGLGFPTNMLLRFIFVSFFVSFFYAIFKLIKDRCSKNEMFAFGPFLIIGFLMVIA